VIETLSGCVLLMMMMMMMMMVVMGMMRMRMLVALVVVLLVATSALPASQSVRQAHAVDRQPCPLASKHSTT